MYGGEAVHLDGEVVGRVRSAAYGFTVQRNVALAKVPAALEEGAEVQVDVLGELVPAIVSADALYDPENERVRATDHEQRALIAELRRAKAQLRPLASIDRCAERPAAAGALDAADVHPAVAASSAGSRTAGGRCRAAPVPTAPCAFRGATSGRAEARTPASRASQCRAP